MAELHSYIVASSLYKLCRVSEKNLCFVILSYLCFDSYELHENFENYIGGVACC